MLQRVRHVGRRLRAPLDYRHARSRLTAFHGRPSGVEFAVDLALDFGGRGLYKPRTTQLRSEILRLASEVAALDPERIVEIGTHKGGTLLIWAQLASREVLSCDLEQRAFICRLAPHFPPPGGCRVSLLEGDTHRSEFRDLVWSRVGAGGADFLFIDGDHTEEGVAQDYQDYGRLVRAGGLIAFHDIVERQPIATNEVARFWKRLRTTAETEDIIADREQTGFGIGLLRVPQDGRLPEPTQAG